MDSTQIKCHNHVMVRVAFEAEAVAQLAEAPQTILRRLEEIIRRLQDWPKVSGAKPLRGELTGHWRIRTGDWRVQFRVVGDEVIIERVGHRDGFYD